MEVEEPISPRPASPGTHPSPDGQFCMALSQNVVTGIKGPRTMKFSGSIMDKSLVILVDPGSSHIFGATHCC